MYNSFEEAVERTVEIKRTHEPNPEMKPVYDKNYETYLQLYEQLKSVMGRKE